MPFWMVWQRLQRIGMAEKGIDETGNPAIALAPEGPSVSSQHGADRKRFDRNAELPENHSRGHRRAAAFDIDVHFLAGEILDLLDGRSRQHVHLLVINGSDVLYKRTHARKDELGPGIGERI